MKRKTAGDTAAKGIPKSTHHSPPQENRLKDTIRQSSAAYSRASRNEKCVKYRSQVGIARGWFGDSDASSSSPHNTRSKGDRRSCVHVSRDSSEEYLMIRCMSSKTVLRQSPKSKSLTGRSRHHRRHHPATSSYSPGSSACDKDPISNQSLECGLFETVSYGLLCHNTLGDGGIRAGGLLVLDSRGGCVPGSLLSGLLLGREPVQKIVEHFGVRSKVGRKGGWDGGKREREVKKG